MRSLTFDRQVFGEALGQLAALPFELTRLALRADDCGAVLPLLGESHPRLRVLGLHMRSGRAPWSVEGVLELLERRSELQGLHLSGTTPDSDVGQLFAKREAGNLSSLSLTYNRLGEAALESLVRATHLEKLRELDLSYNHALTNDAAKRLVKAPQLQKLRRLGLRASSRIGVAAFTTARGFGDLEHLDLRDNSNPEKSAAIDKLRLRFGAAARIGYDSDV